VKIHLVGSVHNEEDEKYLKSIIEIIYDFDASLALNWVDPAVMRLKNSSTSEDWPGYVKHTLEAIKQADIVIADISNYGFSQGFQVAAAIEYNKPTLIISRNRIEYTYITGFQSHLLTMCEYITIDDLPKVVEPFIKKNVVHTKDLRFNMFLTRKIVRYLDERSEETGVNRSEIVRDLIRKASERQKK
jgi:hypothetical protein